jgi:hypothetical protein
VAEATLSHQQAQQADLLSGAYLGEIEKEQASKVQDLQQQYSIAHSGLVSFLTLLDPDTIEKWIKSGKSLAQLDDRFVQMRVTDLLKSLREKALLPNRGNSEEAQKLVKDLENQNCELREALDQAKRRIDELEQESRCLRVQTTVQKQVEQLVQKDIHISANAKGVVDASPVTQGIAEPAWMVEWRKKTTFDRDAAIISLMGETGISRRPLIIQLAASRMGIKPENSAIVDAINRVEKREMIEKLEIFEKRGSETGGVNPFLYRLTEQGRQAFWLLTGKNALDCEFDVLMRRHKTPEHTLLNMRVREFLEDHKVYQVLLESTALVLPDGHKFEPDITAKDLATGELVYIEVERDANKDTQSRVQKWQSLYAASNGNIRVICDKPSFMRKLASEINFALSGLRFATYISNLEEIEQTLTAKGSIWIMERK